MNSGLPDDQPKEGVPPPVFPNKVTWADQSSAKDEERNWSSLDEVRQTNDRNWLVFYGWIVIAIAVIFLLVFLGSLVIWALHYMLPTCYLWLSGEQLSKIQSVLFSGGMGAVISSLIKRQMDRLDAGSK